MTHTIPETKLMLEKVVTREIIILIDKVPPTEELFTAFNGMTRDVLVLEGVALKYVGYLMGGEPFMHYTMEGKFNDITRCMYELSKGFGNIYIGEMNEELKKEMYNIAELIYSQSWE